MLLSLFGNGFGPGAPAARRLQRLRYHAARASARLVLWCDHALRAWGARRLAREMESWPEERLRDIGLARAEIGAAIEGVRRPYRWVPDHDAARLDPERFGR